MRILYIIKSLSLLLIMFSISMLPPMLVGIFFKEIDSVLIFILSTIAILGPGIILFILTRKAKYEPHIKDGFLIVVLFWLTASLLTSTPFILSLKPNINWTDSFFEAVSGLTATGATTLINIDHLPRALLYYRQQLQFLGGMGVILLAVAVLPALGIGGMQMFQAEFSGPNKDQKLTPRIKQSAKSFWGIYIGLTFLCASFYWSLGMDLFDAISYSFSTVSTGGFATHDESIGFFKNNSILAVSIVFMLLGSINFARHFTCLHNASIQQYWKDLEIKVFIGIIIISTFLIASVLLNEHVFFNLGDIFLNSLFHVVSLATTTGFSAKEYYSWPLFIPILLLLLGIVGGCAGSTSGGIKMIRLLLLTKQGIREIHRLIHPKAHYVIKIGKLPLSNVVIDAIWGFLAIYFAMFALFLIALLATGLDFITAYSSTAAALSNIGPALGDAAANYHQINPCAKVLLSFAMIIGRLEFFTVLVLFSQTYWRD